MTSFSVSEPYGPYLKSRFSGRFVNILLDLLSQLQWKGDAKNLRDALPYEDKEIGFSDFLNIMTYLGHPPKIINASDQKLNSSLVPCFVRTDSFFAKPKYKFFPDVPEEKVTGTLYIFREKGNEAYSNDGQSLQRPKVISWFRDIIYRFHKIFIQVFLAGFVINMLTLVTPLFMMAVYDKVIQGHSPNTLKYLLIGIILAVGIETALRFLRSKSITWFGARLDYIINFAILERLLSLPASFTERAAVGAQLSRLRAFDTVKSFFTGPLFINFVELPFTIILLAAIAMIGGSLVLIPLCLSAVMIVVLFMMKSRLKKLGANTAYANAVRENMHIETVNKLETLRFSGIITAWENRYKKSCVQAAYHNYKYDQAISQIDNIAQGLIMVGGLAMIYFGVDKIWNGDITVGAMVALLILVWRTLIPLQAVCTSIPRIAQVKNNIVQINRLMDLDPEYQSSETLRQSPDIQGKIEFYNVGLRYSKDSDAIYAGLSFTVKPGQLVAVTGTNGAGKSTTLKLVSGLYHPQAGSIRIDDIDIRQIDILSLRQNIAYIPQNPTFFTATLAENMRFVRPLASDNDIIEALQKASLGDWFDSLEKGLDTVIGDSYQHICPQSLYPQIAVARAYLQDAKILLIDEMPYEFLNSPAGQQFYDFLANQKGRKTIIFVTYRQDYIDLSDLTIEFYQDAKPTIRGKN